MQRVSQPEHKDLQFWFLNVAKKFKNIQPSIYFIIHRLTPCRPLTAGQAICWWQQHKIVCMLHRIAKKTLQFPEDFEYILLLAAGKLWTIVAALILDSFRQKLRFRPTNRAKMLTTFLIVIVSLFGCLPWLLGTYQISPKTYFHLQESAPMH